MKAFLSLPGQTLLFLPKDGRLVSKVMNFLTIANNENGTVYDWARFYVTADQGQL